MEIAMENLVKKSLKKLGVVTKLIMIITISLITK